MICKLYRQKNLSETQMKLIEREAFGCFIGNGSGALLEMNPENTGTSIPNVYGPDVSLVDLKKRPFSPDSPPIKPMLAKPALSFKDIMAFFNSGKNVNSQAYVERKYDGERILVGFFNSDSLGSYESQFLWSKL